MVFDSVSSNIDEVLSINPSPNVFIFGDFHVPHKVWLTYSDETDRPGELFFYLKGIPDCDSPALLDYFFLLVLVFVLQWLSLHLEILIMLLSHFPLTFR